MVHFVGENHNKNYKPLIFNEKLMFQNPVRNTIFAASF
jgi:hypothetical protein